MILAASIYGFAPAQVRRWCTHETTPLSDLEARLKNWSCEDDEPQDTKRADARGGAKRRKDRLKGSYWRRSEKITSRLRGVGDGVGFRMTLHFFILALFSIPALSCVVAPFLKPVR